jgi:hypothetical protein
MLARQRDPAPPADTILINRRVDQDQLAKCDLFQKMFITISGLRSDAKVGCRWLSVDPP